MSSGPFTSIQDHLQVLHLKRTSTDLMTIGNRRFMYHPSGFLILGDEDRLHPGKNLYSSHAEEFAQAQEQYAGKLPAYDEFCRGWLGTSKQYPHAVVHFAPAITTGYLPHYEAAFDFIEASQQNGLTEQTLLRGFCDVWEQTISHMLGHDQPKQPTLDHRIHQAKSKTGHQKQGRGDAKRTIPTDKTR